MTNTINTEFINSILEKYSKGESLTRKETIFYNGKIGTLKANYTYCFTDIELIEYTKCANDIFYFIENYIKYRDVKTGEVKQFILRPYQKEILQAYKENRFILYRNSRQIGFSAIVAAIYLYETKFHINKKILSIHNKYDVGIELLNKVKEFYLNLPYFLKAGITTWNNALLSFDNNSIIKVSNSNNRNIENFDLYHINDFAHIPPNILKNTTNIIIPKASQSAESKLIISSSPNGFNLFYDIYEKSQRKDGDPEKNMFKSISTYWWEVDGRDQEWKDDMIKALGSKEQFEQEYNNQFYIYTTN